MNKTPKTPASISHPLCFPLSPQYTVIYTLIRLRVPQSLAFRLHFCKPFRSLANNPNRQHAHLRSVSRRPRPRRGQCPRVPQLRESTRTHGYPRPDADCQQEADNCYRNLIDANFAEEAVAWCPQFLAGTTTAASAIPTNFGNCDGDVVAVSSACSCITYTATATASPSSTAPPTTLTTAAPETTTTKAPETTSKSSTETEEPETSECETETEEPETSTSTTKWTTSTLTTTTTRTFTQCPSHVVECPGRSTTVTTVETIVTTTVCPVTEAPSQPPVITPTSSRIGTVTVPTTTKGPKPTSSVVTGGAGRAVRGVEGIAAVAGLFAAFL